MGLVESVEFCVRWKTEILRPEARSLVENKNKSQGEVILHCAQDWNAMSEESVGGEAETKSVR